jgi:hypothetical protein
MQHAEVFGGGCRVAAQNNHLDHHPQRVDNQEQRCDSADPAQGAPIAAHVDDGLIVFIP